MINLEKVCKIYRTRRGDIKALDEINLHIKKGEFVVVRGPSGSGKTTLLLSIGGMLHPTEGKIIAKGRDLYAMSKSARARFRAENIGFVFQMFHLVPYLDVVENVLLSSGVGENRYGRKEAEESLNRLNLLERLHHKPSELSTGEIQRTATARALLNKPTIVLADEPTGNLDPENTDEIIRYLKEYHGDGGTVIVVTHGTAVDQFADRVIRLKDGHIEESL